MKKKALSYLLVMVMMLGFAGCSGSENSNSTEESSAAEVTANEESSQQENENDRFNQKETICNVEYYVPENAKRLNSERYIGFRTDTEEISARELEGMNVSVHSDSYINQNKEIYKWKNIEKIEIDECTAVYFEDYEDSNSISTVSVQINAPGGTVEFNITGYTSLEDTREIYKDFIKHIKINGDKNAATTTKSLQDEFNQKYGDLPTWKDVKYDTSSYIGKNFTITDAVYEIDDYYNFDYRNTEEKYFCFKAQPSGSYETWYIYADRQTFDWLFKQLKEKKLKGSIVVKAEFKDAIKYGMATLVDTQ